MFKMQRIIIAIIGVHLVLLQCVNPSITVREGKFQEKTLTTYGWQVRWLENTNPSLIPGFDWSVDWTKLAVAMGYSLVALWATRRLLVGMEAEISRAYSRRV